MNLLGKETRSSIKDSSWIPWSQTRKQVNAEKASFASVAVTWLLTWFLTIFVQQKLFFLVVVLYKLSSLGDEYFLDPV